jgi:hypothetical protein
LIRFLNLYLIPLPPFILIATSIDFKHLQEG